MPPRTLELALDARAPRRDRGHQVVEDAVGDRLVEGALVAVRPEVELPRLELDAELVGHVLDADGGEVGLAGLGAQAGELGAIERGSRSRAPAWGWETSPASCSGEVGIGGREGYTSVQTVRSSPRNRGAATKRRPKALTRDLSGYFRLTPVETRPRYAALSRIDEGVDDDNDTSAPYSCRRSLRRPCHWLSPDAGPGRHVKGVVHRLPEAASDAPLPGLLAPRERQRARSRTAAAPRPRPWSCSRTSTGAHAPPARTVTVEIGGLDARPRLVITGPGLGHRDQEHRQGRGTSCRPPTTPSVMPLERLPPGGRPAAQVRRRRRLRRFATPSTRTS